MSPSLLHALTNGVAYDDPSRMGLLAYWRLARRLRIAPRRDAAQQYPNNRAPIRPQR